MQISKLAFTLTALLWATSANADDKANADNKDYVITTRSHQFSPAELAIPAGQKIRITISNKGDVPVEFESTDLNREKIIVPGEESVIFVGPLEAGTYKYYDDFRRESSGTITAK